MSTLSLRLPDSLHARIRELAKKDQISINQFATTAIAEKISAMETEGYLANRAQRASRVKFDEAMKRVADVAAEEADRI